MSKKNLPVVEAMSWWGKGIELILTLLTLLGKGSRDTSTRQLDNAIDWSWVNKLRKG